MKTSLLRFGLLLLLLYAALLLPSLLPSRTQGELTIDFLDVGQGDSAVIRTPSGQTFLIDTGGVQEATGDNMGRRVEVPFLRQAGIRSLKAILLTHPHTDHIGGCATLLQDFAVGEVLDNGQEVNDPAQTAYLEAAHAEQVPVAAGSRGESIDCGDGVQITLLAPTPAERQGAPNNASLVARITYGRTAFLMMGDAEAPEEDELVQSGLPLGCDVLKAGHHGSDTSSTPEFLQAAHPHVAIISVGAHNSYGHPSPDVLQRLTQDGIKFYRTDRDGAIEAVSDGVKVTTHRLCR